MLTPFAIEDRIRFFTGRGGWPECELSAPGGQVQLTLYGGQVLSYSPAGKEDLLWLSPNARFEDGRAIRGGIPICWPWFGPHSDDAALPQHGFVRNRLWEVRNGFADSGLTRLTLGLTDTEETRALWPHSFELELEVELSDQLTLRLTSRNTGGRPFQISEALHSYFRIGDLSQISIEGLDGCRYQDKLDQMNSKHQEGPVRILDTTDRVYDHDGDCLLIDPASQRKVLIQTEHSGSTIVWNPGEGAATIGDIGVPNQQGFVCVESGNALQRRVEIAPGQSHTLSCTLALAAQEN